MPLVKSALSDGLESLFASEPPSAAAAAAIWANAYISYAAAALATAGSLPTNAAANHGALSQAIQAGLETRTAPGAGAQIALGVIAFWQAIAWAGPAAAGATTFPGNVGLAGALGAIFADLSGKSAADKANDLAEVFDLGAKAVIVTEQPFAPAPPIVGPIR